MGAYWHIPLLSLQASRIDPAMLKWLAPNGLTYFFQKKSRADLASNKAAARKIESEKLEFGISTSGKWLAYFDNSLGYLRIEDINNPDCYFLYKNGRLVRFSEKRGKSSTWNILKTAFRPSETRQSAPSWPRSNTIRTGFSKA